jgi:hypothetical protein
MAMHDLPSPASGRGAEGEGKSNPLLDRAKQLRQHQTDAEARLWYHLRDKQLMGLKFTRQKPITRFALSPNPSPARGRGEKFPSGRGKHREASNGDA